MAYLFERDMLNGCWHHREIVNLKTILEDLYLLLEVNPIEHH